MKTALKFAVVLGGYVAAFALACGAVAVRVAATSGPGTDASSGMYAFGDGLVFIAVFGAGAMLPTALAFFFLRPQRWFWIVLSVLAVAIGGTAIAAAVFYAIDSMLVLPDRSPLAMAGALGVMRMLVAPPLAGAFLLAAVFAPFRTPRWILVVAAGVECAVAAFAVLKWFVGPCFI
jgi:hypothetical protein